MIVDDIDIGDWLALLLCSTETRSTSVVMSPTSPRLGFSSVFLVMAVNIIIAEFIKYRRSKTLAAQDVGLEPVWKDREKLVLHVSSCWYSKDIVEFCF
jgi:hypothetical protein